MALESATYVSQLDANNPLGTDPKSQGDDHIRLLKSTIKATLPNFTAAPLTSTQAQIDGLTGTINVSGGNIGVGGAAGGTYRAVFYGDARVITGGWTMGGTYTPQSGDVGVGRNVNGAIINVTAGIARTELDAAGNYGLGVTPSAWGGAYRALQVGPQTLYSAGNDLMVLASNFYNDGTNTRYIAGGTAGSYNFLGGRHVWATAPVGTAAAIATLTEVMSADAFNNFQIGTGTSTPVTNYKLFSVFGTTGAYARFYSSGTQVGDIGAEPASLNVSTRGAFPLNLNYNGTTVLSLQSTSLATYSGLEIGYRDVPRVTGGLERGKAFATASGLTVNTGPAAGSTYCVYNDSGASITLTQGSGLTMRLTGTAASGSRTLAARGFATIWFNSTTECIVSGSGVT